jgi:hypothetical protein
VKRPATPGDQLTNELLADDMIREASPAWLEFYRQVRECFSLQAKAAASNLPRANAVADSATRELRYVMDLLDQAEREKSEPPIRFE